MKSNKSVNVKVDKWGRVLLDDLKLFFGPRIDSIKYYSIKVNKDKTLKVKFYDKNAKVVKPNVE